MIPTVLFDLDGTILDTNELIIESFLHTLEGRTTVPYTRETLIPHMGKPLVEQLRIFSGQEDVEELVKIYRAYNFSRHDELVKPFPYVQETMAKLHAAGVKIGVVTVKIRQTSEMGLALCGLRPYIDSIVTSDDVTKPKPDPEGIYRALREMGAEGQPAIMVGDSYHDILAGQNANIMTVGVSWSLKGREFLEKQNPTYIIDDIRELLPIVGVMEA
ncbi:pyrophosphatase PpaX [Paenibacillus albiflavus]|uniref:Pyrophosphatase PpaX n=1 Tax=Paenibacillus albiflavus TaxID=2545760 RepID=A0A4R4E4F8_9BACL|nr:pyrophosphatase PpaX [Paenibacillus albiflavus]TCZ72871.1 pyrophosphatase PpaX [Paenibacillus albiflavus]